MKDIKNMGHMELIEHYTRLSLKFHEKVLLENPEVPSPYINEQFQTLIDIRDEMFLRMAGAYR